MSEKLEELISQIQYMGGLESRLAEHLIANDVILVVRCKNCKHCIETSASSTKIACTKGVNWRAVEQNHFCSYGERKDNESNL